MAVVKAASVVEAEEAAVPLAIIDPLTHTVLSHSKRAITNFCKGVVGKTAARSLWSCTPQHLIPLVWSQLSQGIQRTRWQIV